MFDLVKLQNLAGTGLAVEEDLARIARDVWELERLEKDIRISQVERKMVDGALAMGRQEIWDYEIDGRDQKPKYVRRGDTFPQVEQRGYVKYPSS